MDILSMKTCALVAGGDGEATGGGGGSVAETIGQGVGKALHGLTSKEAAICGVLSPVGVIIGAVIHFNNNH